MSHCHILKIWTLISFIYITSEELFYVADCFFFFSFFSTHGLARCEERRAPKKKKKKEKEKKRRGGKKPPRRRVGVRKRRGRDSGCTSIWSASFHRTAVDPADGLTDRTGTTSIDNTRCEGGVRVYPPGPAFCLKRGGGELSTTREITAWLFFFFSFFFFALLPHS